MSETFSHSSEDETGWSPWLEIEFNDENNPRFSSKKERADAKRLGATYLAIYDHLSSEELRKIEAITEVYDNELLKISDLEKLIVQESTLVTKEEIIDSETGIVTPVYTLHGLPFKMLTHTVGTGNTNMNENLAKQQRDDPGLWDKPGGSDNINDEVNIQAQQNANRRISASLWDEHRLPRSNNGTILGFSEIGSGLMATFASDGGTKTDGKILPRREIKVDNILTPDELLGDNPSRRAKYNEVLMTREVAAGTRFDIRRPNFVVDDGNGSPLKYAQYFNVPIIKFDHALYNEQFQPY